MSGNGYDVVNSESENSSSSTELCEPSTSNKRRKLSSESKKSLLFGSGATDETIINKIVDLVTQKLTSTESSDKKIGRGIDLAPPTAELVPNDETTPPLPFNNSILKNDDNDSFGKIKTGTKFTLNSIF